MASATAAIRFVVPKGAKQDQGSIHLPCHVKPGASSKREGITAVTAESIELCVSAQAKEGEANKAVRELIAEVLNVPKSDVEIAKGMKSRDKTIVGHMMPAAKDADEQIEKTRNALQHAIAN